MDSAQGSRPFSGQNPIPELGTDLASVLNTYKPEESTEARDNLILQVLSGNSMAQLPFEAMDSLRLRLGHSHSTNPVVQMVTQLIGRRILGQLTPDVRSNVVGQVDTGWIRHLGGKGKQAVLMNNVNEILHAGQQLARGQLAFNDSTLNRLTHAARALGAIGFGGLGEWQKIQIAAVLIQITHGCEKSPELTSAQIAASQKEFVKAATALIKQVQPTHFPDDLNNHPAFHGDALAVAIKSLEAAVKQGESLNLAQFVTDYCESVLKEPGRLLIRPSATQMAKLVNGAEIQVCTVTRRRPDQSLLNQRIFYVRPPDGDAYWTTENPAQSKREPTRHGTVQALLARELGHYRHQPRLDRQQAAEFAHHYYASRLPDESDEIVSVSSEPAQRGAETVSLHASVRAVMMDPISGDIITGAMIAPSGASYSNETISTWLVVDMHEPGREAPCTPERVRPNHALRKIEDLLNQPGGVQVPEAMRDFRDHPILKIYEDPITGALIRDPVVAPGGDVYDRNAILKYLEANEGLMPDGKTKCTADDLYTDVIAAGLIGQFRAL